MQNFGPSWPNLTQVSPNLIAKYPLNYSKFMRKVSPKNLGQLGLTWAKLGPNFIYVFYCFIYLNYIYDHYI